MKPDPEKGTLDIEADHNLNILIQNGKVWICGDGICVFRGRAPTITIDPDSDLEANYRRNKDGRNG